MNSTKNLEEIIYNEYAEEMRKSVDFDILCDVMTSFGWSTLTMKYNPERGQAWSKVINWVDENFTGQYREHNGRWLIENAKDATMLALKWKCE